MIGKKKKTIKDAKKYKPNTGNKNNIKQIKKKAHFSHVPNFF